MDSDVFNHFRSLIHREAGIFLNDEKKTLLANRIGKRIRELGLSSEGDYLRILEVDATGEELVRLIDAVSTNVTHFYRESDHFETFAKILQQYGNQGRNEIKVWCSASSSGEEPYTLAMVVREHYLRPGRSCKILATDISTKVLRIALAANYEEEQLAKLPPHYRKAHFIKTDESTERPWQVHPETRELVFFRKLNLSKFPFPLKGPINVIFCRNVMIYFDLPLRRRIIAEFGRLLEPGGYLFLSHSENLLGIDHSFETIGGSVFRKKS